MVGVMATVTISRGSDHGRVMATMTSRWSDCDQRSGYRDL